MKQNLQIIKKVKEVEKGTGISILPELVRVPPANIVSCFKKYSINEIVGLFKKFNFRDMLAMGIVIRKEQIISCDISKFKILVRYGNPSTISRLNKDLSINAIIKFVNNTPDDKFKDMLISDSYDVFKDEVLKYY